MSQLQQEEGEQGVGGEQGAHYQQQTKHAHDPEGAKACATLIVTRFSAEANEHFLRRLFSAYGHVKNVEYDSQQMLARVSYPSTDDADTAIAVLHLRYETVPGVPILVMYDKVSPRVSSYGRQVGETFAEAVKAREAPRPIPLRQYDTEMTRGQVRPPPEPVAMAAAGYLGAAGGGGGFDNHHHHHQHHGGGGGGWSHHHQQHHSHGYNNHHHHHGHHHYNQHHHGGGGGNSSAAAWQNYRN